MRRVRPFTLCLLAFFLAPLAAFAQEPFNTKYQFGGEIRLRSETQMEMRPFIGTRALTNTNNDSFVLLRLRPFLKAEPMEKISVFVQPQFSRAFAQEEGTVANATNIDDLDLHQGYVDFLDLAGGLLSVRLGRQELAYGKERLVGPFGWSNVGRNFDAAKLKLNWEKFWLDGFFAWIQRSGGNQYFGGTHGHWDIFEKLNDEPFFYLLRDNDGGLSGGALTVYTIGDRLAGTFGDHWDFDTEAAVQLGESGGSSIFAFAAHADGGYTFLTAWKPRVGLEYNAASGDEAPASGRVKTFNNLFPTNHDKYGYMDLVGLRNIHNPRFSFKLEPAPKIKTTLDYHAFFLMEPADGLFHANAANFRPGFSAASPFVGQEIDWLLSYDWNRFAKFLFGYSFFKAGDFISDTGTAQDAHFLYAQTTVNF